MSKANHPPTHPNPPPNVNRVVPNPNQNKPIVPPVNPALVKNDSANNPPPVLNQRQGSNVPPQFVPNQNNPPRPGPAVNNPPFNPN